MRNDPIMDFMFRHTSKFIAAVFAIIVLYWLTIGIMAAVLGPAIISDISENGLKSVVERIWEGEKK